MADRNFCTRRWSSWVSQRSMRFNRGAKWGRSRLTTGSGNMGAGAAGIEPGTEVERGTVRPAARPKPGLGFRVRKQTAIVSRWLHIYLSMVSFAVVLFFAATGLTLNHPDWFGEHEATTRYQGTMTTALLHESGGAGPDKLGPDKLGIVEFFRNAHKVKGAVSEFRVEDDQISVSFKGPGYAADGFVQRDSGKY